ncbi:MAG: thioredoxin domain-containing protein [Methanomassiliicoccales archaeon]
MSAARKNRLASEKSPYLLASSTQSIDWFPWCDEAFEKARNEGKPILLDIGASWCHWCHVMDETTYSDQEIASYLNDHFVAVKVDRDERPDIDARYQKAMNAMTGQGGWPLTVFMDSNGIPFFGGTYFPPKAANGMPGFIDVLKRVNEYYSKDEGSGEFGRKLVEAIGPPVLTSSGEAGRPEMLAALQGILDEVDTAHGGFGYAPKFPHVSAIEFLMEMAERGKKEALSAIRLTLDGMQSGGIHDQLGGGFHRYSTDEAWKIPHFEKMSYDNAGLLTNFLHGYQITGDASYLETARGIVSFLVSKLGSGYGFFASQDADAFPGDDGDYWTWTTREAERTLERDEFKVADLYFHLSGTPEMKERGRHVLFRQMSVEAVAAKLSMEPRRVSDLLRNAVKKLIDERNRRVEPKVDRTVYANYTGMVGSALLEFAKSVGDSSMIETAVNAIDGFASSAFLTEQGFAHTQSRSVRGFLDDQVWMGHALIDLYSIRQSARVLSMIETVIERLGAYKSASLLSDMDVEVKERQEPGLLATGNVNIFDAPAMASNTAAVLLYLRTAYVLEKNELMSDAKEMVNLLVPEALPHGPYASSIFLALGRILNPPAVCYIVGDASTDGFKDLWRTAAGRFLPGKELLLVDIGTADTSSLSETAISMVSKSREAGVPMAFVCMGSHCSAPCETSASLNGILNHNTEYEV